MAGVVMVSPSLSLSLSWHAVVHDPHHQQRLYMLCHPSSSSCTLLHCSPQPPLLLAPELPPFPSPQQQSLLDQLALQSHNKKPLDKPVDPPVRALCSVLQNIQDSSQIDAFLDGLHFPLPVFSSVIQKLGSWNKPHAAFCVFQWLRRRPLEEDRPNVYIYGSILGVMKSSGNFEQFADVLEEMKRNGIEPNLVTYNIIIASYEQQGLHTEAVNAFEELESKGLTPTIVTYRALLRGFERLEDIRGALRLFSTAKDVFEKTGQDDKVEGLRSIVSFIASQSLRKCLPTDTYPDHALNLLQVIENTITNLCVRHYEDIAWACGSGQKDHVILKKVLERRKPMRPPMGVPLCKHSMKVLGKAKKWWAALEIFEHMMDEGPAPDKESYAIIRSHFNFLLNASREKCTYSWSIRLLEKMEAHGILPDSFAWDTALVTSAKKGDPSAAVFIFQKMIERGRHPSILSYGALLSALEKGHLLERAHQVWEHMKRVGMKPNIVVYTIMISVYGGLHRHQELKTLVDEIRASGVQFNLITYNALITTCAKASDGIGALKWLKQLRAEGFQPDAATYSELVKALSLGGEMELARDMCMEAMEMHFVLSQSAFDSVVEACRVHNVEIDLDALRPESSPLELKTHVGI